MEITSLICAETSSQANLGQEFVLFEFGQDIPNHFIEDVTSSCAEHFTSQVDDVSVFQNLEYLISDSQIPQGLSSSETTSKNASETTLLGDVLVTSSISTTVNEKLIVESQQQENNLMDYFNSTVEQLAHCEEFRDLNLLLEQVEMHEILEPVHVSTENVIGLNEFGSDVDSYSIPSVSSELQSSGEYCSLEPPNKKQKKNSAIVNESTCEVSSTKTERVSNLTPETTHQKYMEMRRKNNIASKRSRQIRKEKDKAMESEVTELENENKVLRERAECLEKQRDKLKNYLMTLMAKS